MIGHRMLAQVDSRLRQIKANNVKFGGLHLALIGDFAQLPPVGDTGDIPLYSQPSQAATDNGQLSREGAILYLLFTDSFRLRTIHRQEGESNDQLNFKALLLHASKGGLSREDWQFRTERQVPADQKDAFTDALSLYSTKAAVDDINQ